MSCKLTRPAPQDLFARVRDMFSSTVLAGAPIIPESNEWYAVSLNYAMAEEFYAISEQSWRERDPRFACCENLISMAELDGVYPKPATPAQGYVKITGEAGAALNQGLVFTFGTSEYIPAGTVPGTLSASGDAVVRVQAVVPGTQANAAVPQTGSIESPPPGVNATVTAYGNRFCGGTDAESCEQFRGRYLERLSFKRNYGLDWIKEKVLEWPCVTDVCVRGGNCCEISLEDYGKNISCNTAVELYAIFDGTFPCGMAPECVTDEITEWIFGAMQGVGEGQAEWGMFGKIYTATPAYVRVIVDGLACSSPAATQEVNNRVRDFISRLCPSTTLFISDIETIVRQVLGGSTEFTANITTVIPNDPNIAMTICGDAEPGCDIRICMSQDVEFSGINAVNAGLCV